MRVLRGIGRKSHRLLRDKRLILLASKMNGARHGFMNG
jgi:hypothetical protein